MMIFKKVRLKNYLGNTKFVRLHLLRYDNIHETKPLIENPMNMPETDILKFCHFHLLICLKYYIKKIEYRLYIPNVPPTDPIIPIES